MIDVGINRLEDGLAGDVDFAAVQPKAPPHHAVPGGVGPMTVAMLLANTVAAAERSAGAVALPRRRSTAEGPPLRDGPPGSSPGRRTRMR